jgi:WD40 repeat protein
MGSGGHLPGRDQSAGTHCGRLAGRGLHGEAEEAAALWSAALREAPRLRPPFDRAWFEAISAGKRGPVLGDASSLVVEATAPRMTTGGARRQSWGEAPDVADFLGRTAEREMLAHWVLDERCRVVALLGLGGIGKTLLGTRLAHDLAPSFELVYWRSLRDAPDPGDWLTEAIGFFAPDDQDVSRSEAEQVWRLLELLSEARCLLVLDNFETVLEPGDSSVGYRPGFERYGTLLRQLAETPHRSCLVLTSREEPPGLGPLRGEQGPLRSLHLGGLGVDDGRALLSDKGLDGDEAAWQMLVARCGGNGLALKMVGETIRELFGGSIADYLEYAAPTPIGGVQELLETHIQRLSGLELDLLRWLAVGREPIGVAKLAVELGPLVGRGTILGAVEGLRRRSLLERNEGRSTYRATFTLQSVVLEYVTERLIEELADELVRGELDLLRRWPMVKATAREHVRWSQERLFATPLLNRLAADQGGAQAVERTLLGLFDRLRNLPLEAHGYGPGNLVNLMRLLRGNLRGVDLSELAIRHAFLQEVEAQDASLAGAHLTEVVTTQAFDYPTHVALSADGAYLAAATSTGEVHLWRIVDRTLVASLRGHTGAVWGVALSPDGRLVASGGFDGAIKLWDSQNSRLLTTLHGHTGGVNGVALSTDGRLVASGGYDATVRLWDANVGRLLATLEGHTAGVNGVALSADGRQIVSGSWDHTVKLWKTETGELLATLAGHTGGVWGVALSGDGHLVVSGSFDGTVKLWEADSGELRATLQGHTGGVRGVAIGDDGRLAASGSYDGMVKLWDAATGQLLATLQGHLGGVWGVAVSEDGTLVASGGYDEAVKLWEAPSGRLLATLRGHAGGIRGVALSGDGSLVASGGVDETIRVWETESGRLLRTLGGAYRRRPRRGSQQGRPTGCQRERGRDRPPLGRQQWGAPGNHARALGTGLWGRVFGGWAPRKREHRWHDPPLGHGQWRLPAHPASRSPVRAIGHHRADRDYRGTARGAACSRRGGAERPHHPFQLKPGSAARS